jgi:hypothetical protein
MARLTSILTHLRSEVYEPMVTHSQVHPWHDATFDSVFHAALLCTAGAGVGQQQKSGIDGGVIRKGWSSDRMAAKKKAGPIHGHSLEIAWPRLMRRSTLWLTPNLWCEPD